MSKVKFFSYTGAQFDAAIAANEGAGSLEIGGLYFLSDRMTIMRATDTDEAEEYGGLVKMVTSGTIPTAANAVLGVIYIETDTLKGKIVKSDNSAYNTIFAPSTAPTATVASGQTGAVSGDTVYTYINTTLGLTTATNTGGVSHAGEIVKLNGSGEIANNMLPGLAISSYITNNPSTYANLSNLSTAEEGDWTTVTSDSTESNNGSYIKTSTGWQKLVDRYSTTNSVTSGSSALVESGAVYTAIEDAKLEWQSAS